MGLIQAAKSTVETLLGDQWREYFYCDSMPENVLVTKGKKRVSGKGSNTNGVDNIISNGSIVAVNEGQCMMIIDQGRIAEFCAEPGEFTWNASTEPSLLYGKLDGDKLKATWNQVVRRFTFGGDTGKDQRVYYVNIKEITENKFGTPQPIPFRVVDQNIGLDVDISIRCNGLYSYKITDPMLFYKNVCGNVSGDYTRDRLDGTLKGEFVTALQPALAEISAQGVRYSALPAHSAKLAEAMNAALTQKWLEIRGISVVSVAMNPPTASAEDEAMIKELQKGAVFRNPNMAAAHMVQAQAEAMKTAAGNESGAMMGFMGMNMAQMAGGMNAGQLFQMGQQQNQQTPPPTTPTPGGDTWTCTCGNTASGKFGQNCGAKKPEPVAQGGWKCACGATATGNFCPECGAPKPAENGWTCECGSVNKGKFCQNCGKKKPAGEPLYRCDKCGWEPEDPKNPPKFCPECGDPFDESDAK